MSGWNFNMDEAPRGGVTHRKYPVLVKGKPTTRTMSVPFRDQIIACHADGTRTLSSWIEGQGRWEGFTEKAPPVAWQHLPDAPTLPLVSG